MKIKTSELTGAALDWAVAQCEGFQLKVDPMDFGMKSANGGWWIWEDASRGGKQARIGKGYSPSTNWAHGGPIIDGNGISPKTSVGWASGMKWQAETDRQEHMQYGPTLLIAAMRCFVASKWGDEVEIPEELTC